METSLKNTILSGETQSTTSSDGGSMNYFVSVTKYVTKESIRLVCMYLFWMLCHYYCARYYPKYCADDGLYGFFTSLFLTETPFCKALRYGIVKGAETITTLWIVIGTWFISKLIL